MKQAKRRPIFRLLEKANFTKYVPINFGYNLYQQQKIYTRHSNSATYGITKINFVDQLSSKTKFSI